MLATHLSSRGQMVIPQALRESKAWDPGTKLQVQDHPLGLLITPIAPTKKKLSLGQVIGSMPNKTKKKVSLKTLTAPVSHYHDK